MSGFIRRALRWLYDNSIRYKLPRTTGVYNGVVTRKYYLLDLTGKYHEPEYKQTLVSAARSMVQEGDTVVEIGAGFGVCTVWMAREVGTSGKVVSYEAAGNQVSTTRDALTLNTEVIEENLTQRVSVKHSLVGTDLDVYGSHKGANVVNANDLPDCDVFVTDCEGAELDIIQNIESRPRAFVVETHPAHDAETEKLETLLESYGYQCSKKPVGNGQQNKKHILIGTNSNLE